MTTARAAVLDEFLAHYYRRHPVTATFTGVHDYDDRLPHWSVSARGEEVGEMRALHAALAAAVPLPASGDAGLRDDDTSLDAELARANLEVRIAETESRFFHDRNPALWTGEAIFGCVSLMIRPFASLEARVPLLCARLAAIPAFLSDMRAAITGPIPITWKARALRECVAAAALLEDGIPQWLASHAPSTDRHSVVEAPSLRELALVRAAAGSAQQAFAETARWLEGSAHAEENAYACGEPLLTLLVQRGHFIDDTPRELLARATHAMHEARARLNEALVSIGGSWTAAQAALAADHPAVDDYYHAFERRWREVHDAVIAADVVTWPHWPIRYVPIPAWARASQPQLYWLFYRSPAPFDAYGVYDYVVTPVDASMPAELQASRLAAWNHSAITLNHVVHHGGVGHHLQNWHSIHRSRSRIGTIAAVDAASRIGMFLGGSMAEGWACYATGLTEELGLLTPLEQLSECHTRVRLLARAIVDLNLHLGAWSFDECVAYYMKEVGMASEVAVAETTKNSMFPATALMYWVGSQGIVDLRARMRDAQGSAFSLRAFHDELLGRGAIPVPLVARLMMSKT